MSVIHRFAPKLRSGEGEGRNWRKGDESCHYSLSRTSTNSGVLVDVPGHIGPRKVKRWEERVMKGEERGIVEVPTGNLYGLESRKHEG